MVHNVFQFCACVYAANVALGQASNNNKNYLHTKYEGTKPERRHRSVVEKDRNWKIFEITK